MQYKAANIIQDEPLCNPWTDALPARGRPLLSSLACELVLAAALAGCADFGQCGFRGCPGDAEITAEVQVLLERYPSLQAPNQVYVQTVNHVVYLTGLVNSPFEYRLAGEVASEAAGANRVVNMIGVANER